MAVPVRLDLRLGRGAGAALTARPSRRGVLWPVAAALPVLCVLLALGWWQLQRWQWKTALLARMDAAEAAPPAPLGPAPEPFARVLAEGVLDASRAALVGLEPRQGTLGARLVVPLIREGAPPVLVDLGWVPQGARGPVPEGRVSILGFVHPGEARSWLAASDDTSARHFYTFDPPGIAAALGLPHAEAFALVRLGPPGLPDPARAIPRPPNNHLGYVITWWGLALSLIVVVGAFLFRRLRSPP
ncbi:MAG: SURF1 family protein [Acetobacteraceae bacterium]|nr:SURF1 family protein [Acetobacteraceae bacterium]